MTNIFTVEDFQELGNCLSPDLRAMAGLPCSTLGKAWMSTQGSRTQGARQHKFDRVTAFAVADYFERVKLEALLILHHSPSGQQGNPSCEAQFWAVGGDVRIAPSIRTRRPTQSRKRNGEEKPEQTSTPAAITVCKEA
jgi:hypothetical protein